MTGCGITIDRFDARFGEWLALRAALYAENDKRPDEAINAAGDRQDELAILITTMPAMDAGRLQKKLEVLEHHMTVPHGDERFGHPELIMLAGIKSDIARLHADGILN